ncbi:hypothetical protein IV203_029969 [Nitzschia inconspicua]|uniref:Uncharacterized protein n=1 Tax=Nitzschia inconspicua TaxID=303405 RepID=A0A9K3LRQ7_9STRA|nr:hypothetical protein IV203_029969 [Nitzschia inconspicua]
MRRDPSIRGCVLCLVAVWICSSSLSQISFALVLQNLHSSTLQDDRCHRRRTERGVAKIQKNFEEWSKANGDDAILWVDGNNLRGMGRFEWTPLEVHDSIIEFCWDFKITKAVLVWDHGQMPFVWARCLSLDAKSMSAPQLEMVVLFSGLAKRADDVLLHESKEYILRFFNNIAADWKSMAFVTSDRELNYKLRRQASTSDTISNMAPLFSGSKRFWEMLRSSKVDPTWKSHRKNHEYITDALSKVKESLHSFYKQQRRAYKPRREKTWERAVLAETFRRCLCDLDTKDISSGQSESSQMRITQGNFTKFFLTNLPLRGYHLCEGLVDEDQIYKMCPAIHHGSYESPYRLDKQQRRTLDKYNRFLNKLHDNEQVRKE